MCPDDLKKILREELSSINLRLSSMEKLNVALELSLKSHERLCDEKWDNQDEKNTNQTSKIESLINQFHMLDKKIILLTSGAATVGAFAGTGFAQIVKQLLTN